MPDMNADICRIKILSKVKLHTNIGHIKPYDPLIIDILLHPWFGLLDFNVSMTQ